MKHKHSVMDNPAQLALVAAIAAGVGAVTALFTNPFSGQQNRAAVRKLIADTKQQHREKQLYRVDPQDLPEEEKPLEIAKAHGKYALHKAETVIRKRVASTQKTAEDLKEKVEQPKDDDADHIRKHGER